MWNEVAHKGAARRCLTFGERPDADIALLHSDWHEGAWQIEVQTPIGALASALHIAGRHNVVNALAATACAMAAGVSLGHIAEGLAAFEPVKGRSRSSQLRLVGGHGLTLIDDSYNANPDSVRAAIDVLASLPGPHLLVLGDMGEVGDQGPQFHGEMGAHARASGIESVYALGAEGAHSIAAYAGTGEGWHFEDIEALNAAVLARLPQVHSVLVKGSRFMRMERVVQAIAALAQPHGNHNPEAGHAG
jgi:UDP-N-acetylmuramoyl-tripeptide--D-alanyl-D-alanine ligase